ncbi:4Fe-4S binding protein [Rhodoferax sp.]|uniref:ATP-binding protein n=1 Tax=Rhodoferax sp. TaxID=50421 RepID=UPI0026093FEE|nr:4Fe-4S binding protein [Rhodoferax sp.]MDD2925409.1 4Fe-4S dicluster domain-containing protein [Rhodoferax sp.]
MNPKRRPLPEIDPHRCTGCGWCIATCEWQLLTLQAQGWRKFSTLHDAERCTGCRKCAVKCPFDAIRMVTRQSASDE